MRRKKIQGEMNEPYDNRVFSCASAKVGMANTPRSYKYSSLYITLLVLSFLRSPICLDFWIVGAMSNKITHCSHTYFPLILSLRQK
jgi:hypothetical protein